MFFRLIILLSAISFLTACGGGGGGGVQPTTYPTVSLSTSTSSLAENSGTTVTLTVTASKTSTEDITVTLSTSGTATDGTDYSAVNGSSLTISAGSTTATKTFTVTDNSIYEGNETIIVAIATVSGGSATESGTQSESVTITENESAPTITLATSTSSVAENSGTTVTLTATSSQVADEDVTITLASSGTATNGTDYSSLGGQTITISAGSTTGTKSFTPTDDSTYEGDEVATISISAVSGGGATESGTQAVSITITENESAPTITLATSASSIAENSGTSVTLTVTASQAADEDITVTLSTSGVAIDGTDYTAVNNTTITISSGSTTGTKSFTPTDDSTYEGDEVATIAISAVSGADATESGTQAVSITITENESAPTITLATSASSIAENSGTSVTLTVTASQAADEDITVTLSTSGVAIDGTDYTAVNNTTITISSGSTTGTKSFTPTDDSTYEGDEVATISISAVSGGGATESGTQSESITITENESAPTITMSASQTSAAENSGTEVTLTLTTSQIADEDIVVSLSASGTISNSDYVSASLSPSTVTISAGSTTGTVSATPSDDSIYEGDESSTVSISSVSGANATESGTQSITFTITENESAPTVSIATSASSVYDNGSSLTLTATSTQASKEAITVYISTSGTATEGTDYGNISNITIAAGATTGTTTFNPTPDTVNEGSETATVSISSVSGADSSTSGTTSVTIIINEYALRTATAFTEGTTSEQNTIKGKATWTAIEAAGATHPYEQMGIHKVQSFTDGTNNLTGVGQTIHIADFYCDTNHDIYNNKTITNLDDGGVGESTFSAATSSNNHCQGVAMFAAGDVNARSGIAPDADLILSSIPDFEGGNEADDWARDLDAAKVAGAIASNQSWGYNSGGTSYSLSEFKVDAANLGLSNAEGLARMMHGSSSGQDLTDANTYITALNNFESSGVVVWAGGNDTGETDTGVMAALPELFPSLGEAWIVANVVQYTGDSDLSNAVSSEFTLRGNKCGSAKEYCLSVDGWDVYAATYVDGGVSKYNTGRISYGSSWSAPMVSGGVALMSQAFPNHTPEQLVDRILASANNVWFTPEGNTTFTTHGNSITHGYHSTWGQGVPDFYAALSPITTNANPAMALYTGGSIQEGVSSGSSVSLASSSITPSSSFGDSIYQGLSGEVGYAYDALSGGFKYDMTTRIDMSNNDVPTISLASEMAKLDSLIAANNPSWKNNFSQVLSQLSKTDKLETSLTVGASSLPVQSFFGSNFDSSISLNDYETPYLESGEGGIGLGATYKLGNSRLLVGMTNPINQSSDNTIGLRKSLVASLEYGNTDNAAITLMTGVTQDKDSLLGSTGNDAYSLSGAKSDTVFTAFKAQTQLSNNLSLTGVATLANTNMTKPDNSFVNSASNVKSTSVSLIANKRDLFGDDSMSFFVSQPNRVSDGSMSIRLSNLADSDGSITYHNKDINLEPTARQLDYGVSYRKDFDKDISFSIKHMMTDNLNHKQDSKSVSSSFIGAKYKDLKVGFATGDDENSKSAKATYSLKF